MPVIRHNYVRACRKKLGLTQNDVAYLLGCPNGTKVSRHERLSREPSLQTAFAYQVIFGVPAHELFPGLYQQVEQNITKQTQALRDDVEDHKTTPHIERKLRALNDVMTRSVKGSTHDV